jgi:hypothetical protein
MHAQGDNFSSLLSYPTPTGSRLYIWPQPQSMAQIIEHKAQIFRVFFISAASLSLLGKL